MWRLQTEWSSSLGRETVASITDEKFDTLLSGFERDSIHLETRDAYGTTVELPYMAKWAAGGA